jgi:hypothetical protein
VVEHLLSRHKVLSSNPSMANDNNNKEKTKLGVVVYAYNPSNIGSRGWRILVQGQPWTKV